MPDTDNNKSKSNQTLPSRDNQPSRKLTIADVYPDLSPYEQQEAEYNLRRFLDWIRRNTETE